jgi:hypothetical protein
VFFFPCRRKEKAFGTTTMPTEELIFDTPVSSSISCDPVSSSPALTSRPEGTNAVYVLYPFADLTTVAFSIDQGWIGVTDDNVQSLRANAQPHEPLREDHPAARQQLNTSGNAVVVVIAVVFPGIVVGYGVVLGAEHTRSSLKEVVKREVPAGWQNVLRVGWVRVASVASLKNALFEAEGRRSAACQDDESQREGAEVVAAACRAIFTSSSTISSWTPLPAKLATAGPSICDAVDRTNASMLLPQQLLERSHLVGHPRPPCVKRQREDANLQASLLVQQ